MLHTTPHQVRIATIQAKMLVGTYCSCYHARHWQHSTGACRLPQCGAFPGNLEHLFTACPFLSEVVGSAVQKASSFLSVKPNLQALLCNRMALPPPAKLQYLLDPSADTEVAALPFSCQREALVYLFTASRMIIWPVHRERLRALGLSQFL